MDTLFAPTSGLTITDILRDFPRLCHASKTKRLQRKHGITHRIVTYKEDDLADLLKDVGFSDITVTRSDFGNIKATAWKL